MASVSGTTAQTAAGTIGTTPGTAAASGKAAAAATSKTASGGALRTLSGNFDDFLKLLMTQLQNQDPTNPTDVNQFTSELVQFASVEQQIDTNANLTKLIQLTQSGSVLQGSAMVGKQVEVDGDHLSLQNGTAGLRFATATVQPVKIAVLNAAGTTVRHVEMTSQAGTNGWTWDGKDGDGRTVADGAYAVTVTGASGAVPFSVLATATGVQRKDDAMQLQLGGLTVDMSAVRSVR